jgi:predicted signal transduction protein with EAL and GGDEF domain
MCESLGITATAEGVETAQQLSLLQAEGCTEIQGYLVSRPRPAGEIARLLSDFTRDGCRELFGSPSIDAPRLAPAHEPDEAADQLAAAAGG